MLFPLGDTLVLGCHRAIRFTCSRADIDLIIMCANTFVARMCTLYSACNLAIGPPHRAPQAKASMTNRRGRWCCQGASVWHSNASHTDCEALRNPHLPPDRTDQLPCLLCRRATQETLRRKEVRTVAPVGPIVPAFLPRPMAVPSSAATFISASVSLKVKSRNRCVKIVRISICAKFLPMQSRGACVKGEKRRE
jgi:hypothetical protein